ncbi:aspartyl aminopeptidase [Colletotrichum asianum]
MAPPQAALDFVDFVNASPTPYHACATASKLLEKAGFTKIKERDSWNSTLRPGGKYYLTRNGSSIVAFAIGKKWKPGNPVAMIGAHTDSPCLRIKPVSKKNNVGFLQVGVETYGGGIWHSWFDRDLSIAGRVLVKDGEGNFVQKLIKEDFKPLKAMTERHHPHILDVIAAHAEVEPEAVVDFELVLYDIQKSCLGGLNDEFIFSARLDNLNMTYCSVEGLIASVKDASVLDNDTTIRLVTCFDHEEIGSTSAHGANSNLLPAVLRRLASLPGSRDTASDGSYVAVSSHDGGDYESTAYEQTLSRSFLVSADMAHSVHPNYAGKYESSHQPAMNGGTVIKVNANQRYATNSPGIVLLQECARLAGVPLQLFVVRNDSPCGSTIGPMLSAKLGVRTLDLGNPQLSMHSIRETGGSADVEHAIKLFESFYERFGELEEKILVD